MFQLALIFIMLALAWLPYFINAMIVLVTGVPQSSLAIFINMFTILAHGFFNAYVYLFMNPLVGDAVADAFPCLGALVSRRARVSLAGESESRVHSVWRWRRRWLGGGGSGASGTFASLSTSAASPSVRASARASVSSV